MKYDLLIKGGTAVMPFHGTVQCDIGVRDEKTVAIADEIATSEASQVVDARGKYVFPGAVDSHFHVDIYRPHSDDAESESRSWIWKKSSRSQPSSANRRRITRLSRVS